MTYQKKMTVAFIQFVLVMSNIVAGQESNKNKLARADSLFFAQNWEKAKEIYEKVIKDTTVGAMYWSKLGFINYNLKKYDDALTAYEKALTLKPIAAALPTIYSRMAKVYAINKKNENVFIALDSAVRKGYSLFKELDTLSDFNAIRSEERFKKIREQVYINANPCMADAHHREFDFWVGEWNVFQTASMVQTGAHSSIQMISGGCAILENWESPGSNGKSINFVDPVTNKWKQSWAGNYANGTQEFVNGEYKDGAMRFEFTTTGPQGQKITGHLIFYNQGPNQVRQFNEYSADEGKTWTTSYDFTYVRKK
jgi:hypothetical protein